MAAGLGNEIAGLYSLRGFLRGKEVLLF